MALSRDVISYNAAISACEKGEQWERALELLEEMKRRGSRAGRRLVQTLCCRHCHFPNCLGAEIFEASDRRWALSGLERQRWIGSAPGRPETTGACSAAVARVILYHTLLEYAEGSRKIADLAVVTGQGHGSGDDGPVLPTSTRQFLTEEMDPALEIRQVPSNPGMFVVPAASIQQWVSQSDRAVQRTLKSQPPAYLV